MSDHLEPFGAAVAPDSELVASAASVRARVRAAEARAGRPAGSVTVVAVTKTIAIARIAAAYQLGFRVFGENRVQEAAEKRPLLDLPDARWELIGHLQSNKAARAIELFDRVQSIDSVRLAEALDARVRRLGQDRALLPVLLEVNVAGEASKSGFAPDELLAAAGVVANLPGLLPQGLMTVAPLATDPEEVRPVFRRLRILRDDLRERVAVGGGQGWDELSMGMTDDFEVAIEEGATLIRIGRALFGARTQH